MPAKDKNGREYAHFAEVKEGDKLEIDDGFDCMIAGSIKEVVLDYDNELAVKCNGGDMDNDEIYHTLDGDKDGYLIGMYKVK
jgi:hypothetical protein